jgi:hypothetical protein
MDCLQRLSTIDNFATMAYESFKPILEDFAKRRAAAREEDIAAYGPMDDHEGPIIDGAEQEVAYEEYSPWEANELVGLFALVHIVSSLEMFLDALLNDAHLKRPKKKKPITVSAREVQKVLLAIQVLEDAIGKKAPVDTVQMIRDIINARNDFVHNRGYRRTAKRFFNDGDDRIVFGRPDCEDVLRQLRALTEFFEVECQAIGQKI